MPIEYNAWCVICGFRHNRPSGHAEHPREKKCEVCGEVKPLSAYSRNNGSWNERQKICLKCATAQKAQVAARKAEERVIEEAKPLLLVLPVFPQTVNTEDLPDDERKIWIRGRIICQHCEAELPTVKRRSQRGLDFEVCRPFSPVSRDEDGGIFATRLWYCGESCFETQHKARVERAHLEYVEFRASLGIKLADALAKSPRHCALNQMGSYLGIYPIEYAELLPSGKVVAQIYEFEGESRDIVADTPAELDETLFSDGDGYWPGPEYWYPGS